MSLARDGTLEQRLDDVVTSYLEAVEAGSDLDREKWLDRFPDLAEGLSAFFADTDRVRWWTDPLCQAVREVRPWKKGATRFGDYELHREIGRGGKGVVYEARQVSLNRVVALKMVRIDQLGDETERQRLRNEAETAALLDHPRVVPVHDVGERDGQLYFSMKLLEGGSLDGQLDRFAARPRSAAQVVAQVARAVHHAHQRGVLHRDLKPSNILLDAEGQPHVADFGLARRLANPGSQPGESELTQSGAILGTPSYMAPEQTVGDRRAVTTAADVYGLGGILYALLTGGAPFVGGDVLETMLHVRERTPESPARRNPRVEGDLATICLKCLEKDPVRRYSSAEALAEDLERWLAGKPIVARPMRLWERAWKWARRHPSSAGLLVVSAVSLVTVVTGVAIYNARLVSAVTRAETGEARAWEQQLRADANYRKARDTVQSMLRRLENRGLAGVPRLRELEQQQLEDALAFYQAVLQDLDSPAPEVRLDVARTCWQTARIQGMLGRTGAAEKNYRQAIELADGLRAEDPGQPEYRAELAAAYTGLGMMLRQSDARRREAERCLKEALRLRRELADTEPAATRRNDLADTLHVLTLVYFGLEARFDESQKCLDEAVAIWEELVRDRPDEDSFRFSLATAYSALGHYHEWRKPAAQWDAAAAVYRKAEPLLRDLVARNPGKIEWAATLASLYARQGNLLLNHHGKPAEALNSFTSALESARAILKQEPQYAQARGLLVHAHGGRAYALDQLNRLAEAVPEWDRVVELEPHPGLRLFRRSERACVLVRSGDHVRAVAEATALTTASKVSADVLFNSHVACILAVSAALKDQRLSEKERKALAEKYGSVTVALMERLRRRGFLKGRMTSRALREDSDYAPLLPRADWQKFLRRLDEDDKAKTDRGSGKRD
jgi:tetratricopeptide (TPR) repeat protein/tRNA A-37 threonylcarbamoyl transferase component Bud32